MTFNNAKSAKLDIYQVVTDRIIADMEKGVMPWHRPWNDKYNGKHVDTGLPFNASSLRRYNGVNVLILWSEARTKGYASNGWLTYKQASAAGGNVRKGEKGTMITYTSKFIPKAKAGEKQEDVRPIWLLRAYWVFNVEQCENLTLKAIKPMPMTDIERHEAGDKVIADSGAKIMHGGNEACYSPSLDMIKMPEQGSFPDQMDYYRTLFHELGHWTGNENRLNRFLKGRYGDQDYAFEELVAEQTAAFVSACCGIEYTGQHARYVKSWLEKLANDKKYIFKAASLASNAANYLLGDVKQDEEEGEEVEA